MIILTGRATVRAEQNDAAKKAITALSEATRQEPGCVRYRFFSSVDNPQEIILFSEWQSAEALDAHFAQEYVTAFLTELAPLLETPTVLNRYDVTDAYAL